MGPEVMLMCSTNAAIMRVSYGGFQLHLLTLPAMTEPSRASWATGTVICWALSLAPPILAPR
jgi:hypothetical protein